MCFFKISFYISSALFFITAIVWIIFSGDLIERCKEEKKLLDGGCEVVNKTEKNDVVDSSKKGKEVIPKSFYITFIIFSFFAICHMFLRKGINIWMPTILKEKYG